MYEIEWMAKFAATIIRIIYYKHNIFNQQMTDCFVQVRLWVSLGKHLRSVTLLHVIVLFPKMCATQNMKKWCLRRAAITQSIHLSPLLSRRRVESGSVFMQEEKSLSSSPINSNFRSFQNGQSFAFIVNQSCWKLQKKKM